jgi:hypothetical protein
MTLQARHPRIVRFGRLLVTALAALTLGLVTAGPALAYQPVKIVHTERVQAGPYGVTLGFSAWPIRAMQSLDFTFVPDGGIAGKTGTLLLDGPGVKDEMRATPLVRHPRKRDVWGLDVKSLNVPGSYSFGFAMDGPQGHGQATLSGITVLNQPGPPLGVSWAVASLPFLGLLGFLVVASRRTRPGRHPLALF